MTLQEQIAELSALTRIYLLQENSLKGWLQAEADTYQFFKKIAQASKSAPPKQPAAAPPKPAPTPQEYRPSPTHPLPPVKVLQPQVQAQTPPREKTEEKPARPAIPAAGAAAAAPAEKKVSKPKEFFKLDPLPPAQAADLSDIRTIVTEKLPGQKIVDVLPDDTSAKKPEKTFKIPDIVVLSFNESQDSMTFLQNMTRAIAEKIAPAGLMEARKIERENGWNALLRSPDLRLIVASSRGIHTLPELMKAYKEDSRTGLIKFGKIPVLLLADTALYQKEPHLKRELWKTLQEMGNDASNNKPPLP